METALADLGIEKLSVADRIRLIGKIWDSFSDEEFANNIPPAHLELLERRIAEADANPSGSSPWSEVESRLRARRCRTN
jgi:putative addiction module component (TIGR02574 family)